MATVPFGFFTSCFIVWKKSLKGTCAIAGKLLPFVIPDKNIGR